MWPFRNKDKLKKRKLLINISIGSACALVVAGLGLVIGYVLAPKKVSGVDTKSPYFTTKLISNEIESDGEGNAEGDAIVQIDLYNDADFSKLSFDPIETNFTATPDPDSKTFTITTITGAEQPAGFYTVKINSDDNVYGSQDIGIIVKGDGQPIPYFTASLTEDTLNSDGDGDATISVIPYDGADFGKITCDDNGWGFTVAKNNDDTEFILTLTAAHTAGDFKVKIKSDNNIYGSQEVGIHIAKVPDPIKEAILEGPSTWNTLADRFDYITYKLIDTSTGDIVPDVTYSVEDNLPPNFYWTKTSDNQLIIQGSEKDAFDVNVKITAESLTLGVMIEKTLRLIVHKFVNVPVDATFYDIDASTGVIQGFSDAFLGSANTVEDARAFLTSNISGTDANSEFCMDLHNQTITGTQYAFSPLMVRNNNINKILPLFIKLDLSYTQWQWNTSGNSGDYTFGGNGNSGDSSCIFSNVKLLDLRSANFAVKDAIPNTGDLQTANGTFSFASFPNLETSDFSGMVFATSGMATDNSVSTANKTFDSTSFGASFETLDLSGTVFAATNMTTNGDINTASLTFNNARFSAIETLDLKGIRFSISNMSVDGEIKIAFQTFQSAIFTSLKNLNLFGAVFSMNDMTKSNKIYTAYETFRSAKLTSLKSLNLAGAVFCVSSSTVTDEVFTAHYTFANADFSKLETLNLAGTVFATNGMTSGGVVSTASHLFESAALSRLKTLNLGDCELGNKNDGTNTINDNCFDDLQKPWTTTNKLKIIAIDILYWQIDASNNVLKSWFGDGCYELS